jgi:hypothetical protein
MSSTLVDDLAVQDKVAVQTQDWAMQRARSGAAWLDAKFGRDWDRRIDFEKVQIGSPIRCIVGQLITHGYLSMLFATNIVQHGFSRGLLDIVVVLLPITPVKRAYQPLTNAWKIVLRERRGETAPHAVRPAKNPTMPDRAPHRMRFTQAA